jgi:hypothetical protein
MLYPQTIKTAACTANSASQIKTKMATLNTYDATVAE